MDKKGIGRGNNPASLNNLKKPLPASHETAVVRVSGPSGTIGWWKTLEADERGRILEQARALGLDGSTVTEETDWN